MEKADGLEAGHSQVFPWHRGFDSLCVRPVQPLLDLDGTHLDIPCHQRQPVGTCGEHYGALKVAPGVSQNVGGELSG